MPSREPGAVREAITALYETHFDRVFRYILVRVGNRADAEDLASEVFLRALRSAETFQDTGAPLAAWLFRIAHNVTVDCLRKRATRPVAPLADAGDIPDRNWEADPAERLERAETVGALGQAVRRLTLNQQQVLALRFGAGLSSEEIGRILEKKAGAARELQSAALKKLRVILAQGWAEPGRGLTAQGPVR